jgi:hypothetical protein
MLIMSYYGARSRMARLTLAKMENDQRLSQIDKSRWYDINDLYQLGPQLTSKFLKLYEDDETKEFTKQSIEKSEWFFTQLFQSMFMSFFKLFMASTSVNGLILLIPNSFRFYCKIYFIFYN